MTEPTDLATTDQLVITRMEPGCAIEANFVELGATIDALLADYRGAAYVRKELKEAKRDRAYLNNLAKELDSRRLEVKRRYMKPVDEFEIRVKDLIAPIKECSAAIDEQVKRMEAEEAAKKRAELKAHYEAYAPILVESVPFERIEDAKWLNATVNLMTAFAEIEDAVDRIARDEATLDELALPHALEAKATYFETLDLSRAIARSKEIEAQLERTRRFEAEKAEILREQVAEQPHETVLREINERHCDAAPEPASAPGPEPEPRTAPRTYTVTVSCSEERMDALAEWLRRAGYDFTAVLS